MATTTTTDPVPTLGKFASSVVDASAEWCRSTGNGDCDADAREESSDGLFYDDSMDVAEEEYSHGFLEELATLPIDIDVDDLNTVILESANQLLEFEEWMVGWQQEMTVGEGDSQDFSQIIRDLLETLEANHRCLKVVYDQIAGPTATLSVSEQEITTVADLLHRWQGLIDAAGGAQRTWEAVRAMQSDIIALEEMLVVMEIEGLADCSDDSPMDLGYLEEAVSALKEQLHRQEDMRKRILSVNMLLHGFHGNHPSINVNALQDDITPILLKSDELHHRSSCRLARLSPLLDHWQAFFENVCDLRFVIAEERSRLAPLLAEDEDEEAGDSYDTLDALSDVQGVLDELNSIERRYRSLSDDSEAILAIGDDDTNAGVVDDLSEVAAELADLREKCGDLARLLESELDETRRRAAESLLPAETSRPASEACIVETGSCVREFSPGCDVSVDEMGLYAPESLSREMRLPTCDSHSETQLPASESYSETTSPAIISSSKTDSSTSSPSDETRLPISDSYNETTSAAPNSHIETVLPTPSPFDETRLPTPDSRSDTMSSMPDSPCEEARFSTHDFSLDDTLRLALSDMDDDDEDNDDVDPSLVGRMQTGDAATTPCRESSLAGQRTGEESSERDRANSRTESERRRGDDPPEDVDSTSPVGEEGDGVSPRSGVERRMDLAGKVGEEGLAEASTIGKQRKAGSGCEPEQSRPSKRRRHTRDAATRARPLLVRLLAASLPFYVLLLCVFLLPPLLEPRCCNNINAYASSWSTALTWRWGAPPT
ncbi:PREDICTED: uncharacterized protein LOC106819700 [Priapulus caudatus]|uniref:Uncharacterized protein LOC106819700 n=1 Tax=Priapulus caudatus TaxID=37621 RepID=A0ABM1F5R9_PRICU|nr:PREDICTED: uncharacterized protein LOC106819700 [Priapulus caudatus]